MPSKHLFYAVVSAIIVSSCGGEKNESSNTQSPKQEVKKADFGYIEYKGLKEMVEGLSDFHEENGTYKLLTEKPLHIQISKPFYANELKELKLSQGKHYTLYFGLCALALTPVQEITVTFLPMNENVSKGYDNSNSTTLKLTKTKAKQVLKKYFNTEDFKILFKRMFDADGKDVGSGDLSKEFKQMLYDDQGEPTASKVFAEFKK